MYRIIFDTNVLVAALKSRQGASFRLLSLVGTNLFDVGLTVPLVLEYEDVLQRQPLNLSSGDIQTVLDYLCAVSSHHKVHFLWRPFLRDAKDDLVLEAAVAAQSKFVVSFNLRDFSGSETLGVRAIEPAEFLRFIGV